MAPAPLNHKQKRFALEYRVDANGTQAAIRAGYSTRGADVTAVRLLADPRIRALIEAHQERVLEKVAAKGDKVLEELAHFAHSDLADAFRPDGTLMHVTEMPEHIRRAIRSVEFTELFDGHGQDKLLIGRTVKLTLWDKPKGLELLGRNAKLFQDKVQLEVGESLAELLAKARAPDGES